MVETATPLRAATSPAESGRSGLACVVPVAGVSCLTSSALEVLWSGSSEIKWDRRIAMLSTIALFSSSRRQGNTGRLIDRIASELQIEIVDLADLQISPFDYDHRNRGDDFEPALQHILAHDQIIFASPIYWYSVSAPMKVFL